MRNRKRERGKRRGTGTRKWKEREVGGERKTETEKGGVKRSICVVHGPRLFSSPQFIHAKNDGKSLRYEIETEWVGWRQARGDDV